LTVLVLLLSSCSSFKPEKEIVTVEKIVKPTIAIALKPTPIEMKNADVLVVTEQNFQEVVDKVKAKQNGQFVVYALDLKSFENLAINMEQIKRYIEQQNEVILYYEKAVTWEKESDEKVLQ
tara:strand:- start:186 stop:548 length:363 start_codon:yes stop_codon:yes gene_type:complete